MSNEARAVQRMVAHEFFQIGGHPRIIHFGRMRRCAVISQIHGEHVKTIREILADCVPVSVRAKQPVQDQHRKPGAVFLIV